MWNARRAASPFRYSMPAAYAIESPMTAMRALPGVFRLAAPGRLRDLFAGAGARTVAEDRRPFTMEAPLALDEFWPFLLRLASPTRAAVATLPPAVQARVAAAVREAVAPCFAGGAMCFPAEMVVVRAARA